MDTIRFIEGIGRIEKVLLEHAGNGDGADDGGKKRTNLTNDAEHQTGHFTGFLVFLDADNDADNRGNVSDNGQEPCGNNAYNAENGGGITTFGGGFLAGGVGGNGATAIHANNGFVLDFAATVCAKFQINQPLFLYVT